MHVSFGTVMLFSLACTQLVPLKKLGRVNRLMSLGVRVRARLGWERSRDHSQWATRSRIRNANYYDHFLRLN